MTQATVTQSTTKAVPATAPAKGVSVIGGEAMKTSIAKAIELLKAEDKGIQSAKASQEQTASQCWNGIRSLFFAQLDSDTIETQYAETEAWKTLLATEAKAQGVPRGSQYASNLARAYKLARSIEGGATNLPQELRTCTRNNWINGDIDVTIGKVTQELKVFWEANKNASGAKPKSAALSEEEASAQRAELAEKAGNVAEFVNEYMAGLAKRYHGLAAPVRKEFENQATELMNRLEAKSKQMQGGHKG